MAFILDQFNVMDELWNTLDKTPDGNSICYTEGDIVQLWIMGFVDTQNISIDDWVRVFEPYLQSDGTYLLNHDNFVALEKYRYKGEIRIPFDAMKINEGKYTDEGLDELIKISIRPSCGLSDSLFSQFVENLKKDFRQSDDLILIKTPAKMKIRELLEQSPSPLRNLEILMDHMIQARGDEFLNKIEKADVDAATKEAAIQVSKYSSKPSNLVEEKAEGLKNIEKSTRRKATSEVSDVPKVELKKIKRSRRGMRG